MPSVWTSPSSDCLGYFLPSDSDLHPLQQAETTSQIENFLFSTSNALTSSWNPIAARPPGAGAEVVVTPPAARGLLVALLLPAVALLGSESEGVGCSSAERLALLLLETVMLGGDWDMVLGGGVELWGIVVGRGPGMLRPGPGVTGGSCANWCRGDSSLMRTCAR